MNLSFYIYQLSFKTNAFLKLFPRIRDIRSEADFHKFLARPQPLVLFVTLKEELPQNLHKLVNRFVAGSFREFLAEVKEGKDGFST
eukprot:CAMPEP_0202962880 /NCGR_PEP_ID=MMETSP1396-20130829/6919_1 /ASSEMBLY_ACC=CAM_ASM_000872 /TAXON_ID= /ORGANISM="Pseudokeronopsis sp., Strain Brazil" /LENGTH=85 /DNA_ID=CAMNT_0049683707 /DNA_START=109 /DNA_END=366 /DNA_ORIENTATION=+